MRIRELFEPGSEIGNLFDPGSEIGNFRIREKHPGSATLLARK
jgi:hypothetical protein